MLDPIADMLTRIRNAQVAGKAQTVFPMSKLKLVIAQILEREGFVARVEQQQALENGKNMIVVWLKYIEVSPTQKKPAIQEITRVSKQGCRVYVKSHEVKKVKNGYGVAILSTSQGVMTGGEAYAKGLGGEYLCKVW